MILRKLNNLFEISFLLTENEDNAMDPKALLRGFIEIIKVVSTYVTHNGAQIWSYLTRRKGSISVSLPISALVMYLPQLAI